jgi:hypothetical protein
MIIKRRCVSVKELLTMVLGAKNEENETQKKKIRLQGHDPGGESA